MPVLYYKEDYATLEINLEGDYVLRVVGAGPGRRDFVLVLEDEELDRYREWGEHFVVTMAHRIHRDPERYAARNLLAPAAAPQPKAAAPPPRKRFPPWAAGAAFAAAVVLLYISLVATAIGRKGGEAGTLEGRAVGFHSVPDESGDRHYLTVELADGSKVQLPVASAAGYRENAALLLRASRSPLFGRMSYRFEKYR